MLPYHPDANQLCMQVLGHTKTLLVLLGGWAFLHESISRKQLGGMLLAFVGMVMYGIASYEPQM